MAKNRKRRGSSSSPSLVSVPPRVTRGRGADVAQGFVESSSSEEGLVSPRVGVVMASEALASPVLCSIAPVGSGPSVEAPAISLEVVLEAVDCDRVDVEDLGSESDDSGVKDGSMVNRGSRLMPGVVAAPLGLLLRPSRRSCYLNR